MYSPLLEAAILHESGVLSHSEFCEGVLLAADQCILLIVWLVH